MDSKNTYLKHIIREELNLVKEQITLDPVPPKPKAGGTTTTPTPPKPQTPPAPKANPFKSQQSADHFRKWLYQHHSYDAPKLGIGQTGPMDDPKLINAFHKWKKDYWADTKTQAQAQKDRTKPSDGLTGGLGLTAADLMRYGIYVAIGSGVVLAGAAGIKLFKGASWLFKKVKGTKLTPDQAMNIASNPKAFKQTIDKIAKANPKQLKKELQDLNPDAIISDDDVKAMQAALGNERLTVDILIQARRKNIITFQNAIAAGKLPTTSKGKIITADQLINTLTAAERARYANTIRQLYAKIKKKQQFKNKVKKTWNNFREKLPYGD
jgi:hypothetical protein